jgi:hypothetical protein
VDSAGNLYIAATWYLGGLVEKVTPQDTLSIVAGVADEADNFKQPTPGPATRSDLGDDLGGIAVDLAGNLYIADPTWDVVEKVTPDATLSIVAGIVGHTGPPTPGAATKSDLGQPVGIAVDSSGNLYIADGGNRVVEKVTPGGTLSIVAGTGQVGSPTPGPATASDLASPEFVAVDSAGDLYIADNGNHVVEKVTPEGTLSIVAGIVSRVPGAPAAFQPPPSPGPANRASIVPGAVAVDSSGNLYVVDTVSDVVAKVTPGGILSIVAGCVSAVGCGARLTPAPALQSPLAIELNGIAVDPAGSIYIADGYHLVVEKVTKP